MASPSVFESKGEKINSKYLGDLIAAFNSAEVVGAVGSEFRNNVEIITCDEEYIYVISPFKRDSNGDEVLEEVESGEIINGYHIYRYNQRISLWNGSDGFRGMKTRGARVNISLPQLERTLPNGSTDTRTIPNNIYIPRPELLRGYPTKQVIMEELLHLEDISVFPWIFSVKYQDCLGEFGKRHLIDLIRKKYDFQPSLATDLEYCISERSVIGELYPLVIMRYLWRDSFVGKESNRDRDELIRRIQENDKVKEFDPSENSHAWADMLMEAVHDEVMALKDISEVKSWFRKLYKD